MHKYTDEEKQFLKEFTTDHSHKEIWKAFNDKFNSNIGLNAIKQSILRYNLNTGRTGHFPKGHIPANKGLKGISYPGSVATQFKKGHSPVNHREVGSERITKDGYIEVKVSEPNRWKLKHRIVWEQAKGPILKGYAIVFKDQNKQNCTVDNLILVKRSELARLNQNKLFFKDPKLTEVGINIAKLMAKTYERSKKCKT